MQQTRILNPFPNLTFIRVMGKNGEIYIFKILTNESPQFTLNADIYFIFFNKMVSQTTTQICTYEHRNEWKRRYDTI